MDMVCRKHIIQIEVIDKDFNRWAQSQRKYKKK